jgi:hypothetical protein
MPVATEPLSKASALVTSTSWARSAQAIVKSGMGPRSSLVSGATPAARSCSAMRFLRKASRLPTSGQPGTVGTPVGVRAGKTTLTMRRTM